MPRPSISLRGSSKHYRRVVNTLSRRADRLAGLWHQDFAVDVRINTDDCFPYHAQPGPRVGSLEVILAWRNDEDPRGWWEQVVIFSKLETRQFCSAARIADTLDHLLIHLHEESELMALQAAVRRLHCSAFFALLSRATKLLSAKALRALTQVSPPPPMFCALHRCSFRNRIRGPTLTPRREN